MNVAERDDWGYTMRKPSILMAMLAILLGMSAAPAVAAPSNSPNSEAITFLCGDAGEVTVFATFNSSGAALFQGDDNGRQFLLSWYKLTDVENPEFYVEKTYGHRNGFDTTLECTAGPFEDPELGISYTAEMRLASK